VNLKKKTIVAQLVWVMDVVGPKVMALLKVHFYTQCKQCSYVCCTIFLSSCFFGLERFVSTYLFLFLCKCFQNSKFNLDFFIFVCTYFFKIIILDFQSIETKLSKMTHCAWTDETIEHNFLNFWTNFDFKEWVGWDFMAEIANTWNYNCNYTWKWIDDTCCT